MLYLMFSVMWQRRYYNLVKQWKSSCMVLKASLFPTSFHRCPPPSPLVAAHLPIAHSCFQIAELEQGWSSRHYTMITSNITTCGFKHGHQSQRWLLKVLMARIRLFQRKHSLFKVLLFTLHIVQLKNSFKVSMHNKHQTEGKKKIWELNSKLLWADFIPN